MQKIALNVKWKLHRSKKILRKDHVSTKFLSVPLSSIVKV